MRRERPHRRRDDRHGDDEGDRLRRVRARAAVSFFARLAKAPWGRLFGLVAHVCSCPSAARAYSAKEQLAHPLAGRRGDQLQVDAALRELFLGLGHASRTSGKSALLIATTCGPLRELGIELRELCVDGVEVGQRVAPLARIDRHQVKERARALDVLEEADAEPRALAPRRG